MDRKTAVITGASRGLGAGLAKYFVAQGMNLGLCARSACVLPSSETVVSRSLDIVDRPAFESFATEVEEKLGTIDLWINNAAVLEPILPLRSISPEDFQTAVDVNVMGMFHGIQLYVQHLRRKNHPGVLLNISSGAARNGYSGWSAYCATKAAVDLMTESVQIEEEEHGLLRAYSVAPGVIDTEMQAVIRECRIEDFPMVEKFRDLKARDAFNTPEFVAQKLLDIAFDESARPESVRTSLPYAG